MEDSALKDKSGTWLLKGAEDSLKESLVPRVPSWIETYHLTWMTLVWSGLVVYSFHLGLTNPMFFWCIPVLVILQYLTDLLDGAVGRYRDTGLVKWGYYADHFLDYIFLCSLLLGYAIVVGFSIWMFILLIIASAFMIHSFLLVSTNNAFHISLLGIGPTESRVFFILAHSLLIVFGMSTLETLLPYIVGVAGLSLLYVFLSTQINLWKVDMHNKHTQV